MWKERKKVRYKKYEEENNQTLKNSIIFGFPTIFTMWQYERGWLRKFLIVCFAHDSRNTFLPREFRPHSREFGSRKLILLFTLHKISPDIKNCFDIRIKLHDLIIRTHFSFQTFKQCQNKTKLWNHIYHDWPITFALNWSTVSFHIYAGEGQRSSFLTVGMGLRALGISNKNGQGKQQRIYWFQFRLTRRQDPGLETDYESPGKKDRYCLWHTAEFWLFWFQLTKSQCRKAPFVRDKQLELIRFKWLNIFHGFNKRLCFHMRKHLEEKKIRNRCNLSKSLFKVNHPFSPSVMLLAIKKHWPIKQS